MIKASALFSALRDCSSITVRVGTGKTTNIGSWLTIETRTPVLGLT